jgi:L-ascorbate metabolism protein UlaG (beta-lactamase superfamily)
LFVFCIHTAANLPKEFKKSVRVNRSGSYYKTCYDMQMDKSRFGDNFRDGFPIYDIERENARSISLNGLHTPDVSKDPGSVSFRWLGVGGVELSAGGQVLVVDPFFTRPSFSALFGKRVTPDPSLVAAHLPRADFVLVTHAHYDHLMDVPEVLRSLGASGYASPNACRILAAEGIPARQIHEIADGAKLELGVFKVDAGQGIHGPTPLDAIINRPLAARLDPPLRLGDYRMDTCFSFLIQVNGLRIQCGGQRNPADVLLINPNKSPEHYRPLLQQVKPRLVIPIHWEDFFSPLTRPLRPMLAPPRWAWPPTCTIDLARFKRKIEEMSPRTTVLVPEIFKKYDLM